MVMLASQMAPHAPRLYPLATLLAGHGGVAVITLLRNVIAARLIGIEQFGIATSFAIVVSAIEMGTTLGAQQMIVQDHRGDKPAFQGSLHLAQLMRGAFGGAVLYLLADPIAALLNIAELAWVFEVLAIVPVFAALCHLDSWRYQRAHRFWPSIVVQLGPALFALMLIGVLVNEYSDFRALLIAIIAQSAGILLMSHLVAERRYLVTFNITHLKSIFRFGIPLALNGLLLLGAFHGEKLLIGHLRGPEALALLAMGFSLTLTPALVAGKSLQSYFLPRLGATDGASSFWVEARLTVGLCLLVAVLFALTLSVIGPVVPALLGKDFAPLVPLMPLLALLHAIRLAKTGVAVVALAQGDTFTSAVGNIFRVAALPVIYTALSNGAGLQAVLIIATIAEAAGATAAALRVGWRNRPSSHQRPASMGPG